MSDPMSDPIVSLVQDTPSTTSSSKEVSLNTKLVMQATGSKRLPYDNYDPNHYITSYNPDTEEKLSSYNKNYNTDFNIDLICRKVTEETAKQKLIRVVDLLMDIHYRRDERNHLNLDTIPPVLGRAIHAICVHTDIMLVRSTLGMESKIGKQYAKEKEPYFLLNPLLTIARDELTRHINLQKEIARRGLVPVELQANDVMLYKYFTEPLTEMAQGLTMPVNRRSVFYSPSYDVWKHYIVGMFNLRQFANIIEKYAKEEGITEYYDCFTNYLLRFNNMMASVRDIIKYYSDPTNVNFTLIIDRAIAALEDFRSLNDQMITDWIDMVHNFETSRNSHTQADNNIIYFAGSLDKSVQALSKLYINFADDFMYARLLKIGVEKASLKITNDISSYLINQYTLSLTTVKQEEKPIEEEPEEEIIFNNGLFFREKSLSAVIEGVLKYREPETYEKVKEAYERNLIHKDELFIGFNYVLSLLHRRIKITTRAVKGDKVGLYKSALDEIHELLKSIKEDNFILNALSKFAITLLDYVLMYSIYDDPDMVTLGEDGAPDLTGSHLPCFKYKRALVVGILDKSINLDRTFGKDYVITFKTRDCLSVQSDLESLKEKLDKIREFEFLEVPPEAEDDEEITKLRLEAQTINAQMKELKDAVKEADRLKETFLNSILNYSSCLRSDSDRATETIRAIQDAWFKFFNKEALKEQQERAAVEAQALGQSPVVEGQVVQPNPITG